MATSSNLTRPETHEPCSHRLVVIALMAALATLLIATLYPSGKPADELTELSFGATYAWIAAQSHVLTLAGLSIGLVIGKFLPRLGALLGAAFILAVPAIVLCDAMSFTWIAERFLSGTMGKIGTTLLPSLMLHVTSANVVEAAITVLSASALMWVIWRVAGIAGRRWKAQDESIKPIAASMVLTVAAAFVSLPVAFNPHRTMSEMSRASTRHPFCAFHIVGFRGVGVAGPSDRGLVLAKLRGLESAPAVHRRDRDQTRVSVAKLASQAKPSPRKPTNVIIVVIECLRPDLIDSKIMPNLNAFAQRSILCPNNFSSGNATCYGMFGLLNGLEAIWFQRPVHQQPILNRLLHATGYKIGFYGGQTDWRHFQMDGFISPEHFDEFQTELPALPDTDIRTVERAIKFIDQSKTGGNGVTGRASPRAAVAYMFATHSRYSDPQDRIFHPTAPEHLLMSSSPEMKEQFYNGFKNSARTMDRLIKPLLRDDCVVIILGDHGEPFFDDGTAVHGTRLSRYQNMTPAIIHFPGVVPRKINSPTSHADVLPTLLSILGIPLTDPHVFDGLDLLTASDETLAERSFLTRNYIDATSMLVGPWTFDPNQPFGYRVAFGISDWQSSYLNPIDELGYAWEQTADSEGKERFKRWVIDRFGADSFNESRSERSLFEEFFRSTDRETRLSALKIAGEISDPEDYLYRLIAEATRDHDLDIREHAKDIVIRTNRIRGSSQHEKRSDK